MPPRGNVLQYGIGYSEGEPAEAEPLVIKYANKGQNGEAPFEKRFDRVAGVWTAQAVARVTINSADDIVFETMSLSPSDEALSGTLSVAALKETKGAYNEDKILRGEREPPCGYVFEALCKICRDEHHGSIKETEAAIFEMFHSIDTHVGAKENVLGFFLRRLQVEAANAVAQRRMTKRGKGRKPCFFYARNQTRTRT